MAIKSEAAPGMIRWLAIVAALGCPALAGANDKPLSAIPWLSESVLVPDASLAPQGDVTPLEKEDVITVEPLPEPSLDAAGLVAGRDAAARAGLWQASDARALAQKISGMPRQSLPGAQALFRTLLLSEAPSPDSGGGPDGLFLTARVDALLTRGALDPAQALLERAGPDQPALFRRWFDISLLTGLDDRACATMAANLTLAPSPGARVFCLARTGRWQTAVVTLEASEGLGSLTAEQGERLARFLDPDLFEGEPPLPVPNPVTPLEFRIHEALGEPIPTRDLPLAFARSDLRHVVGWKAQIEAAERLARAGTLSPNKLLGIYTARQPSASGGVWDRVAAIQAFDVALNTGNAGAIADALEPARNAMQAAGLEPVFAAMAAPRLARVSLSGNAAMSAYRLALISGGREAFGAPPAGVTLSDDLAFAAALATGDVAEASPPGPRAAALRAAFLGDEVPQSYAQALTEGRTGEAQLDALARLAPGAEAEADDAATAIRLLRLTGREDIARHIALQLLLSERRQ